MTARTRRSLSVGRGALVDLLSAIDCGRIENQHVLGGEPIFDPPPRILRTVKLGAEPLTDAAPAPSDFVLKHHWTEFFDLLDRVGDAVITELVVRGGLPAVVTLEHGLMRRPLGARPAKVG